MGKRPQPPVPGRSCPTSYRYDASRLARGDFVEVDTLWVAGGLYGNPYALERLMELYEGERGSKALVFNGDFHWFDVDPSVFSAIESGVRSFLATRGNVETELASAAAGAGCGCAYPEWVDDETVSRSNEIIERLRATAAGFPAATARLARLPMHLAAKVGGEPVAVVHGDADSLAGWGFSQESLSTPAGAEAALRGFARAGARIFASSHTCLPVLQPFPGGRVIANNGAAGMPNFRGEPFGLATRISTVPSAQALYGTRAGAVFVEAVALDYDAAAWRGCFLRQWPAGSPAHRSYFGRITKGPDYSRPQALRSVPALAA